MKLLKVMQCRSYGLWIMLGMMFLMVWGCGPKTTETDTTVAENDAPITDWYTQQERQVSSLVYPEPTGKETWLIGKVKVTFWYPPSGTCNTCMGTMEVRVLSVHQQKTETPEKMTIYVSRELSENIPGDDSTLEIMTYTDSRGFWHMGDWRVAE